MADPGNAATTPRFGAADRGHERIETRDEAVCRDVGALQDRCSRPGLKAVGKVVSTRAAWESGARSPVFSFSAKLSARSGF